MHLDCDVAIAGAGPAGAAMAARLVQTGHPAGRIIVLERYRFPRPKPCGGGLTGHAAEAMAELGLALDVPAEPAPLAQVRFGSYVRSVSLRRPVHIVRREAFDASLIDQVRRLGVEVVEGEGVASFVAAGDRVTVVTSRHREISAAVLVGADGAASVVRRHLAARASAMPHRLFRMELAAPGTRPEAMIYDFTPMEHGLRGYLWVFPLPGGWVNVGVMHYPSYRLSGRRLIALLRNGLADHGIALPARGMHGWPAWGYDPRVPVAAPRVLTIGDAAGIDALTGEGIAVAMEHALIAGDSISAAFARGDFSFSDFGRRLRRAVVGRELALDRHLAHLLYRSRRWRDWLSLVLFDPEVLDLYAARVDGSQILADEKLRLVRGLLRHVRCRPARHRALARASSRMTAARDAAAAV